jgi:hypothetical protein
MFITLYSGLNDEWEIDLSTSHSIKDDYKLLSTSHNLSKLTSSRTLVGSQGLNKEYLI